MEKIAFINSTREKKTLKEILDGAFENSYLDYEVSKQSEEDDDNDEERITKAIKSTPKLEVELRNVDYYA